jgi:predicted nuclease of predicted toxin-antitoxin system
VKPPLIVNENFPVPSLDALRRQGVDVLAVRESMSGASDQDVLAKARETGRWLVTFDRDYGELVFVRNLPAPPAILYLRQEPVPPARAAEWVLELLARPETALGYLVVVGEHAIRRRPLPRSRSDV